MRKPRYFALAATSLAVMVVAGCASGSTSGPVDNSATDSKSIKIGIVDGQPGMSNREGDTYSGFDIDTANYVAGELGVPTKNIVWQPLAPGERVPALTEGRVDMVVAAFSITNDRKQEIDFAGPYFVAHQDLLIRRNDQSKGGPDSRDSRPITGPKTLDGRVVCAVPGTTSADYLKENYRGRIAAKMMPSWTDCINSLITGEVDAVTTDDVVLAGLAAQSKYKGKVKVVGKGFTDERYGIGLRKNDDRLGEVSQALEKFISSGAWKRSLDTRVRPSGYQIPSPPAVEQP